MKRDTELWLLVREIRSEYRKMAAMMVKWGHQLEDAESKLRAILDEQPVIVTRFLDGTAIPVGPDAQADKKEESLSWDEQTR